MNYYADIGKSFNNCFLFVNIRWLGKLHDEINITSTSTVIVASTMEDVLVWIFLESMVGSHFER